MSKLQRHQYVPIPIWWLSMQKNCWCYLNLAMQMSWFTVNCLAEIVIMVLLGLLRITTEEEEKEEEKRRRWRGTRRKRRTRRPTCQPNILLSTPTLQFKVVFWLLKFFFFLKIDLLLNVILSEDKGWNHIQGYPQRNKL